MQYLLLSQKGKMGPEIRVARVFQGLIIFCVYFLDFSGFPDFQIWSHGLPGPSTRLSAMVVGRFRPEWWKTRLRNPWVLGFLGRAIFLGFFSSTIFFRALGHPYLLLKGQIAGSDLPRPMSDLSQKGNGSRNTGGPSFSRLYYFLPLFFGRFRDFSLRAQLR